MRAGVINIPNTFATAVLTTAAASFPSPLTVNTTADDMVVGKQQRMTNPFNTYGDILVVAFNTLAMVIPMHGK